jgi:site-specific DNA recombinase
VTAAADPDIPVGSLPWDIYARQSIDSADGIDRQVEDCTREIERLGGRLGRVYRDNDESAHSRRRHRADYRPEYQRLMADVAAGVCRAFVVQDQDRLMRDVREGEDLIDLVERTGCRVVFARSGEADLTRPDGRMAVRMKAVFAKQETEKKAERERRAAEGNARKGKLPKRRAFGYNQDGTTNAAEAAVVLDAFGRLLRGESLAAITRAMQAAGLPTARGNAWADNGVRVVLLNPRYAGVRTYKGDPVAEGTWEKIITPEEHEQAVALLTDPTRRTNVAGSARKWLGGGLYWCGACEHATGELRQHVEIASRTAPGASRRAYVCRKEWHLSRAAEAVDTVVTVVVEERLSHPDVADLLAGGSPELAPLRGEEAELEARLARARDRLDRGVLDEDEFVATKKTIKAELAVVRRKKTAAARDSRLAQLGTAPDPAAAFRKAGLAVRREVIDALADVVLHPSPRAGRHSGGHFDPSTIEVRWRS